MKLFLNMEGFMAGGIRAFSVSISQRERTAAYIHNQVEHHKKMDFTEESIRLLAAHGMQEEMTVSRPCRDSNALRILPSTGFGGGESR